MNIQNDNNPGKLRVPNKNKCPPQVKQTLTSKYRMLKANPLLMYELGKKIDPRSASKEELVIVKPLKTLAAVLDADSKVPKYNINICNKSSSETCMERRKNVTGSKGREQKSTRNILKPEPLQHKQVHFNAERKKLNKQNIPSRGSSQPNEKLFLKNLNNTLNGCPGDKRNEIKSARYDVNALSSFSARKFTAFNDPVDKQSYFPTGDMSKRLSNWLKQRGKNLGEYHHLKCFGICAQNNMKVASSDTEKENLVPKTPHDKFEIEKNTNSTKKMDLSVIVQDALLDLHRLILEGYPTKQCEVWLKLIKQKNEQVEEQPEYWECRAALEQTKGNINLAVECYKTAIIQGAEVQNVDKYLDQLLHKFSLLNISNDTDPQINKEKSNIVKDARNIFKSSIIQFAVQERVFKKKSEDGVLIEKKIIATPVRRSTRLSRSAYTSTPGVHIYPSLQDVDSSVRSTLNFQCNNALRD